MLSRSEYSVAVDLELDSFWSERIRLPSWESLICSFANVHDPAMPQICVEDSKFADWVQFFAALVDEKLKHTAHILAILYRDPTDWLSSIKRTNPDADSLEALELYLAEYNSFMNTALEYSLPVIIVSHERFTRIHQQYARSISRAIESRFIRKPDSQEMYMQPTDIRYPVALGGNPRSYLSNPFFLASIISNRCSNKITDESLLQFLNKLNCKGLLSSLESLQGYTSIVAKKTKDPAGIAKSLLLNIYKSDQSEREMSAIIVANQIETLLCEFADNEGFMIEGPTVIRKIKSKVWG